MTFSRLTINTSVPSRTTSSLTKADYSRGVTPLIASPSEQLPSIRPHRARSGSNASTTSSLSVISPTTSSTNGSTTHLPLHNDDVQFATHQLPSPPGSEYVLAMHDFAPQHQNATCLSFRAGQVIHVLNRDSSGWWDGELEGRRGWFPSNYVNADVASFSDEDTHVSLWLQHLCSLRS